MASPTPEMPEIPKRQFLASILPTLDPALSDRWERSIGIQAPHFSGAGKVHPGQDIDLLITFSGFGTDPHMLADVEFEYRWTGPAGATIFESGKRIALKGRVLHGDFVMKPKDRIGYRFPENAEEGNYRVDLDIRCLISGQSATRHYSVKLEPFRRGGMMREEEVTAWMDGYLAKPRPETALDAYLSLFDTMGKDRPEAFFSVLPFFAQVFSDNPWLAAATEQLWRGFSPKHQAAVSLLFHAARLESTLPALQALILDRSKAPFPSVSQLMAAPVTHPQELDFLWAVFKANGHYDVFKRICTAVALLPEAYSHVTDEQTQEAVMKSAGWSIQQHLESDKLALTYAMAIFKESDLDIRVYRFLEGLLKQKGWVPNPEYIG